MQRLTARLRFQLFIDCLRGYAIFEACKIQEFTREQNSVMYFIFTKFTNLRFYYSCEISIINLHVFFYLFLLHGSATTGIGAS